jgi:hypothetical protein
MRDSRTSAPASIATLPISSLASSTRQLPTWVFYAMRDGQVRARVDAERPPLDDHGL